MFKKIISILLVVGLLISGTSCATIVCGRMQDLPVMTTPSGATVTIIGENIKQQTPATLALDRRKGVYQLKIEKEGYEPVEITLKKGMNGWVWGNLIFGGIIGLIIDISTGSASKFEPTEVEVNLIQKQLALQGIKNLDGKDILFIKLAQR